MDDFIIEGLSHVECVDDTVAMNMQIIQWGEYMHKAN